MYYDRTLKADFSKLIEPNGSHRWLYDFVKTRDDLDFQIGKSGSIGNSGSHGKKEWISIYWGLTRILSMNPTKDTQIIHLDAADSYKDIMPGFFGNKDIKINFQSDIELLISKIENNKKFDRYYKSKKEGYFQNELSRIYGINGVINSDFVIIDKEAVVGYINQTEKDLLFKSIQDKYKKLQTHISSINSKRYGKNLEKKAIGNELDFLALDKEGNILLIEYKHGANTAGIYLSPLQIGLYYDIFTSLPRTQLDNAILAMFTQKQKIGLINPDWVIPSQLKAIIPVLIISNYNSKGSSKPKFEEILNISKGDLGQDFLKDLQKFHYTSKNGLVQW